MDFVPPIGSRDETLKRTAVNRIRCRQSIRENLDSGHLPRDFNLTSFRTGCPPNSERCVGCGEVFLPRKLKLSLGFTPKDSIGFTRIAKSSGRKSGNS